MTKSNECLFIPKEVLKELTGHGLNIEKAISFTIKESDGVLVSEDVVGDFVKETGIRIEKMTTTYDGIYQFLGYIPPAKGKVEAIEEGASAQVAAVAGENNKPGIVLKEGASPEGLRTKLHIAIAALQEVCNDLES